MDDDLLRHYGEGVERDRLGVDGDGLELVRTLELLERFLPSAPARILDVGGGPGVYAERLARDGYDVHLLDFVELHVEQARGRAGFVAEHGDARDLSRFAEKSFDVVLLLGPLYHLTERADRVAAFAEARRVVRAGGVVVAAAITRFASLIDGTVHGYIDDPRFQEIVRRDLREGQHRNPENVDGWFTTAYFHLPAELCAEAVEAGLHVEGLFGVEGPGGWLDLWPAEEERVLLAARLGEGAAGVSPHMLCVARR